MIERHELPRVELSGRTLAIADLHLEPFDLGTCAEFANWTRALDVERFLVLGDLFDAWVGPAHEEAPGARLVIEALRDLTRRGLDVHVLQGNRDFLLGESFAAASGARVHPEGMIGELESGSNVLFLHGDELCTRDLAYQRLRRITHSRFLQTVGPRVPMFLSKRVAARMRRVSRDAVLRKPSEEKAIQLDAVRAYAGLHDCNTLVCGHAHSARDEDLERGLRFLVLDAFGHGEADSIRVEKGRCGLLPSSSGLSDSSSH